MTPLKEIFQTYDLNSNGKIDKNEFRQLLVDLCIPAETEDEKEQRMSAVETDRAVRNTLAALDYGAPDVSLETAFKRVDTNDSNDIGQFVHGKFNMLAPTLLPPTHTRTFTIFLPPAVARATTPLPGRIP